MSTLFDYLIWRGDLCFDKDGFCDIDNVIFSLLSYIDFSELADGEDPASAAPLFDVIAEFNMLPEERKYLGAIIPKETHELALAASETVRYRDVGVFAYENSIDESIESQFCAVSFLLPGGDVCVTYRGTDDTLVGWKENLNMSYLNETYAQKKSIEYLERIASGTSGGIYVCGHSKGGNLAVWASVNSQKKTSDRIRAVYNNDGPGFCREFIDSEKYRAMSDRIKAFIPEHSVVGVFFERDTNHSIIKSSSKTIRSHDAFSWYVEGRSFLVVESRSRWTKRGDEAMNSFIASLEPEEKKKFVDTVYNVLSSGGAKTLSDLKKNKIKHLSAMQKAIKELDVRSQKNIKYVIGKIYNKSFTVSGVREKADKALKLDDHLK